MVEFVTFSDLNRFNQKLTINEQRSIKIAASKKNAKNTFLSHSSKDAEYLPGVIELLENHGASVYCDLGDDRMPEDPSPETAQIIKSQITSSKKLVVFVTINSKDSKWVPWELGVGDMSLSPKNVALLPASKESWNQSWARQEYMGLYNHIVFGRITGKPQPLWMVYDYRTNSAMTLSEWCRA